MKHLLLTAAFTLASIPVVCAQTKPATKPTPKPGAGKSTAALAHSVSSSKPQYAGFLINNKLVSEIDCYGFDRVTVVYPFFNSLNTCDQYDVRTTAGAYDKDGKFVPEYSDFVAHYEGAELDAIREKYGERGYALADSPDLLVAYNANRAARLEEFYRVDARHPAYNILKFTNLDLAANTGSVLYYQIYTSKITSYETKYSEAESKMVSTPVYSRTLIYTSPKVKLLNRVLANSVAPPLAAGKKLAKFGMDILKGGSGANSNLPELHDENCSFKGQDLTIEQAQEVGAQGYSEVISTR